MTPGPAASVSTIPAAVRRAAEQWPRATAVVDGDRRLSWAELAEGMADAAAALVAARVEVGDRVAIWAPNSLDWIIASLGVYAAGGTLLPINTRFTAPEAEHILRRARARLLVTVTDFIGSGQVEKVLAEPGLAHIEAVVLSGPPGRGTSWADFLARAGAADRDQAAARERALAPDDASDIIFTSGTTGRPKGAVLTHGASTRMYTSWAETVDLRHGDRYLVVYPFFHCAGLKSAVLACVLVGATIVPCPVFDVDAVMRLVQRERITVLPGPPSLYQSLLNADLSGYDRSSLRLAVTGAAVVPLDLVRRMRDELGFASVATGYGLTETTGTISVCRPSDPLEVIAATSGRPISGMSVRVVDQDGKDVPAGEQGEVLARGFAVMKGYLDDPEATAAAIDAEGWLHTGDVGVLDSGGYVRITDRIKDMFIVGGFNAYPAEIENHLLAHPRIAGAAVVGVPDARLGEVGYAFVVPVAGAALDPGEVIAWCRGQVANFKVPRFAEVTDRLPLNASGKAAKVELRARAASRVASPETAQEPAP